MKLKILALIIILSMVGSTFVGLEGISHIVAGKENSNKSTPVSNIGNRVSENLDLKVIKVAILVEARLMPSGKEYFIEMFEDYQWIVGNTKYCFELDLLYDKDILNGKLKADRYDLIIVPGGGVGDGESLVKCFPTFKNFMWKRKFASFIKNGGGYYGICGGTAFITDLDLDRKPKSFLEYAYEKSSLGVTWVKSHYKTVSVPLFDKIFGLPPDYVGAGAFVMFTGWNRSYTKLNPSGVCFDCPINNSHPIFDDFLESYRRIRWIGGPSLTVPENPDRQVSVLAKYPVEEMSDNKSTQIHAWEYVGGVSGFVKGFFEYLKNTDESAGPSNIGDVYFFAGDWKCTDKIIEFDFSNQPSMTAEIYPNENKARIVLTGLHPEFKVWWGGYINKTLDTEYNSLWNGLHRWEDIIPFNETVEDEYKYNNWINRRSISWASKKVPDNDLPPVYGPSQVSDIYPYNQSNNFTIYGNSEVSDGIESLDLFYRYSENNSFWSPWNLYDTDSDISDGWSWEFNAPNGTGYYQFYSIRHAQVNEYEWLNETAPPGPDAIARVVD